MYILQYAVSELKDYEISAPDFIENPLENEGHLFLLVALLKYKLYNLLISFISNLLSYITPLCVLLTNVFEYLCQKLLSI